MIPLDHYDDLLFIKNLWKSSMRQIYKACKHRNAAVVVLILNLYIFCVTKMPTLRHYHHPIHNTYLGKRACTNFQYWVYLWTIISRINYMLKISLICMSWTICKTDHSWLEIFNTWAPLKRIISTAGIRKTVTTHANAWLYS